jgi:hypothetical protein
MEQEWQTLLLVRALGVLTLLATLVMTGEPTAVVVTPTTRQLGRLDARPAYWPPGNAAESRNG